MLVLVLLQLLLPVPFAELTTPFAFESPPNKSLLLTAIAVILLIPQVSTLLFFFQSQAMPSRSFFGQPLQPLAPSSLRVPPEDREPSAVLVKVLSRLEQCASMKEIGGKRYLT